MSGGVEPKLGFGKNFNSYHFVISDAFKNPSYLVTLSKKQDQKDLLSLPSYSLYYRVMNCYIMMCSL